MSVPLDRLYHFLHDRITQDVVIYHWFPHGSKKLTDIRRLSDQEQTSPWAAPAVIFHDQEYYSRQTWCMQEFMQAAQYFWGNFYAQTILPQEFFAWIAHRRLNALVRANAFNRSILVHSNRGLITSDDEHEYCYYWSHALLALDWYRYARHDSRLQPTNQQADTKRTFLCYNRSWSGTREFRLKFADLIVDNDLVPHCQIGFSPFDNGVYYKQHQFKDSRFKPLHLLENYFSEPTATADASADYHANHYLDTACEVVLETVFDSDHCYLTEKTLRPIACGHPFVLAAAPGSLATLRDYGFLTFGDYIDENYDEITDPMLRLQAIMQVMKSMTDLADKDWRQMKRIAQSNRDRFFSEGFFNSVVSEFDTNMHKALNRLDQDFGLMKFPAQYKHYYKPPQSTDRAHGSLMNSVAADPIWI